MRVPLVSVIIPIFNSKDFILDTLQSVIEQTYTYIEILIIDDGSIDGSLEMVQSIECENIRVFKNKGKGACAARNYGYALSKGDYIQFLDADDILSPDKIQKQVDALNGVIDKLAVCSTIHFRDEIQSGICTDSPYLISTDKPSEFFIRLWGGYDLPPNMVQTSAWLSPRKLIEKYGLWDINLYRDQDGEFFARLGLNSNGIVFVPGIKNYYRKHIDGHNIASGRQKKHLESNLDATFKKEGYLFARDNTRPAIKAMAIQYKNVAIEAWPRFKGVSNKALKESSRLGGSKYLPILGGKVIETIKNFLGWKIAKSVSYYGHIILDKMVK
ncbi:glycosyltransferase family 2 protein [Aegicerativicinus sediminis]|uniref:glycosyltransferase family 2 protein n=1 Tax=Aegicerativicinus sediminis TaxID=2893202 RepID=UPI001E589FF5|nr:glycosyltransferase [Aegicerativicinus sediminis]